MMKNSLLFVCKHLFVAALVCGVSFYLSVYRKKCGADIPSKIGQIEQVKPDIILVGNSVLRAAVDEEGLSKALGKKVLKVTSNGSASAWWYLYLKNVVTQASRPKSVVVFFRDHYLTLPSFRVEGKYQKPLRMLSLKEEPFLAKRALKLSSSFGYVSAEAKERFERRCVKLTANCLRCNKNEVSASLGEVLGTSAMIPELVTRQQLATELEGCADDLDFDKMLSNSLLPEMISIAKECGVELIFVRCKRRRDVVAGAQSEALFTYIKHLTEYLVESGAKLIDTTEDSFTEADYGPGDHLNTKAKELFTQRLSKRLF